MCKEYQLIKIEAVNIYSSVYDTEQLSVIRGSSFLLKKAIDTIKNEFKNQLSPVSTGASSGLFSIIGDETAECLVKGITYKLNNDKHYRWFTFVVVHAEHDDFKVAKEILIAKQRFMQLQCITLAPDYITEKAEPKNYMPCAMQGSRIATEKNCLPGDDNSKISESVKVRFEYGRDNRSNFYKEELGDDYELSFTSDIQTLSESNDYEKLKDKVAVLYLDGNSFSSIQRDFVNDDSTQKEFDNCIQNYRNNFLKHILNCFDALDSDSTCFANAKTIDNELRLETLLWGGDEMIFVVPAWLGFDLVYEFYNFSENWNYKERCLTHAGGLVFCSAKTPISKIRFIANKLADEIKEKYYGRGDNYFDYLVLESIDYPVENSMKDFFINLYSESANTRYPLSLVNNWSSKENKSGIKEQLQNILKNTPKGQIYQLAELVVNKSGKNDIEEIINKRFSRLQMLMGENYIKLIEILNVVFKLPDEVDESNINIHWQWLHLVELWDYIIPIIKVQK